MYAKTPEDMFNIISEGGESLGQGQNIIANHPGNSKEKKTLYITAHYDTIDFTTGVIDNASGVTVVLETAKVLKQINSDINVVFILFDGEEVGLQGSKYFVYNLPESEKNSIIGCINIDMVGEKKAGPLTMKFGTGEHNILSLLWGQILENEMPVKVGVITDEKAFYYGPLPSVTIENENPNLLLNKEENQFEYIDYNQLLDLTNSLMNFVKYFDLNDYEKMITDNLEVTSNLKDVCQIEQATFKKATARVVDNGFLLETCFYYETEDKHEFQISLRKGLFFHDKNFEDYQQIATEDNTINYKIEKGNTGEVQASYYNEHYYGTIKGDIDEEGCRQIIESFNDSEYWQNYI